ncbi:HD domain protein [bacterium YEK0313]|nr:HD domain protein [bacterium YEK0313]
MMTLEQARAAVPRHLGASKRAEHSVFVAHAMRRLAEGLGADAELWEIVGLCHDLDYFETAEDRSRHGMLVADWLEGDLPEEALDAIRAHDHRTGFRSETTIADGLRLADALAIVDIRLGRDRAAELGAALGESELRAILAAQPYLADMLIGISASLAVPLPRLAEICRSGPAQ